MFCLALHGPQVLASKHWQAHAAWHVTQDQLGDEGTLCAGTQSRGSHHPAEALPSPAACGLRSEWLTGVQLPIGCSFIAESIQRYVEVAVCCSCTANKVAGSHALNYDSTKAVPHSPKATIAQTVSLRMEQRLQRLNIALSAMQARFLLARLNPSNTYSTQTSMSAEMIMTDDVSLSVFTDHLRKLATSS